MRSYILVVLLVAGCCEMPQLQPIEVQGAGGINQGAGAPLNSAYDACNVQTNHGVWELRPGYRGIANSDANSVYMGFAEYIPDNDYSGSHVNTVIIFRDTGSAQHMYAYVSGCLYTPRLYETSLAYFSYSSSDRANRYDSSQHLWRYERNGETRYTRVLVFTNGKEKPVIYYQDGDPDLQSGHAFAFLDSIEGGDSSISYLPDAPIGRYNEVYKERLFFSKGNTLYHTGPDPAFAFTCNVWPAAYNLDIGHEGEITGLKAFKDQLVVFKKRSIYTLTGDGVGGNWNVSKIDSEHGAINTFSVVEAADRLFFIGADGIYQWAGGSAQRISHPRLKDLWKNLSVSDSGTSGAWAAHDVKGERVLFNLRGSGDRPVTLVYNYMTDTWDRWGAWLSPVDYGTYGKSAYDATPGCFDFGCETVDWMGGGIFGVDRENSQLALINSDSRLYDYYTGTNRGIPWFIRTNNMFTDDSSIKLLRHVAVQAKKTGAWEMAVLPIVDDDSFPEALRRGVGYYNIINDSIASNAEHDVVDTNVFVAGEDVDVIDMVTGQGLLYATTLADPQPADTGKIEFGSAFATTDYSAANGAMGMLLVHRMDTTPLRYLYMDDSDAAIYNDGGGSEYGDSIYTKPELEKINVGTNVTGRHFALWLSNVGSYTFRDSDKNICEPGMPLEIRGWGVWIIPKGTLRPDGG